MATDNKTVSTTGTGGDDRLAELHEQITEGVAALVGGDAWRAMLDTAARFHSYSLGNLLLIGLQAPAATRVAGFRTWQGLGRQVRKGERGIAILAPCTYRPKPAETPDGQPARAGEAGGVAPAVEPGRRQVRGFRRVFVFDVAQTDGEPLPEVAPVLLTGQAPSGLWDQLAGQVTGHGYTVQRGDCSGANGYTDPATRTVRVRADVDDAQAVKTLAHELGHIECGHVADLPTYATCRGRCEVEAESVAYIVTAAAGMDPAGYTFAYVAHWAGGDLATVRQAAETVTKAAHSVLRQLDDPAADPADQDTAAAAYPRRLAYPADWPRVVER